MRSRFSLRSNATEIMDDLNCSGEEVNQTLLELEVINKWLGGNKVTIGGIKKLLGKRKVDETISVADIGCGGGDILKEIADWGKQQKISLRLTGIDANQNIISFAKKNTLDYPEINFITQNVFSDDFAKSKYDIVVATLFTHHFTKKELGALFQIIERQSKFGVVINDLHRHWLAYYSIRLLAQCFSKSSMFKFDAPLSVLRAFRRHDLESIMDEAGIKNYELRWMWAFRWQLIIQSRLA